MFCLPTTTTLSFHPNCLSSSPNSSRFLFIPHSFNNLNRSSSTHLRPSFCGPPFNNLSRSFPLCLAATPGPPPGNGPHHKGMAATFSRLWDTVQVFSAVFFWMSLFFWASASDRNNTGRGNKGR